MEVLSQEVVSMLPDSPVILLFIPTILLTLLVFGGMIVVLGEGELSVAAIFLALTVAGVALNMSLYDGVKVERTEYKVTVEDFNVLHEDYKIIDQEGEIYTVVKKSEGDNE